MKSLLNIILTAIVPIWLMSGCSGSDKKETSEAASATRDEITLTATQVENAGILYGQIGKVMLSMDIHAKGKLILPPQNQGFITSPMGGTVQKILVPEGNFVKEGTPVLSLVSPALIRLQQDYLVAKSQLEMVGKDYDRQAALSKDKITSDKLFQQVSADYQQRKSQVASLAMELELMNLDIPALDAGQIQKSTHLTAPISGYFDKWMVNPGQYIEQNSSMGLIVNKDRLFVELMVFEKDVRFVKLGQRVTFEMANLGEEEYEAKVLTIGKMVEENARTVKVTAEFLNSSPIVLPGMFVAAEIHTSEQNLDALPEEAVVMEEETSFCYYTTDPEKSASIRYKKIPVRTGFKEDGYIQTELLQPLPPGARIVIKGAYFIKAEGLKQGETD